MKQTIFFELYSLYQNSSLNSFDEWLEFRYPEHERLFDIYIDIQSEYETLKDEYIFYLLMTFLLTLELPTKGTFPFDEVLG